MPEKIRYHYGLLIKSEKSNSVGLIIEGGQINYGTAYSSARLAVARSLLPVPMIALLLLGSALAFADECSSACGGLADVIFCARDDE